MKRILPFLSALLLLLGLALPASADIIFEPDNGFYRRHADACDYVGRPYVLAGAEGTVSLWTAPDGLVRATRDNGLTGTVQYRWKGRTGPEWGYLTLSDLEGWVPLGDLSPVYDSQAFEEDHAGEITPYAGGPVTFTEAVLYAYPEGPAGATLKEDANYMTFSQTLEGSSSWTDASGRTWVLVGYYMGRQNRWICVDDPLREDLDTAIVPTQPSPAQRSGTPTVSAGAALRPVLLAGALVGLAAVITLVLLLRLRRRRGRVSPG